MPSHTIPKRARLPHIMAFTFDEAKAMLDKGFRFGRFQPIEDDFRLAIPYQVAIDVDHDTLTYIQKD